MTIQPARTAAAVMKIAPKLDIENLVPIEEILGGGAVAEHVQWTRSVMKSWSGWARLC